MKSLYKDFIIIILAMGCAMDIIAQPAWKVDPYAFEFNMTITAKVSVDGSLTENLNDKVAAFVDGVCRGVSKITYESSADGYFLYLMVYSNKPGEKVIFKIYDSENNELINAKGSVNFNINEIVGSLDSPYIIASEKLNDKAEITSFTIPEQIGETIFNKDKLFLQKNPGKAVTDIAASFSVSEGAKIYVNGIIQENGKSKNDFSNPVHYTVISADFRDTVTYAVFVNQNLNTTAIKYNSNNESSNLLIYPNPFEDFLHIKVPQNKSEVLVSIYNGNGKVLISQKLTPGKLNEVGTYFLAPGVYYVICTDNIFLKSWKFIKSN